MVVTRVSIAGDGGYQSRLCELVSFPTLKTRLRVVLGAQNQCSVPVEQYWSPMNHIDVSRPVQVTS